MTLDVYLHMDSTHTLKRYIFYLEREVIYNCRACMHGNERELQACITGCYGILYPIHACMYAVIYDRLSYDRG